MIAIIFDAQTTKVLGQSHIDEKLSNGDKIILDDKEEAIVVFASEPYTMDNTQYQSVICTNIENEIRNITYSLSPYGK